MSGGAMVVVGLSHETAGLAAREQVSLDDVRARSVLRQLAADPSIHEAVVLSTCNRTEIYAVAASARAGEDALRRALVDRTALGAATLSCAGYALVDRDAAEHLFRVAAGLESAILGETEIGGQVRDAARRARQEGAIGPVLSAAFERALSGARRVRRRTGISAGATSVGSVVAELIAGGARPAGARRRIVLVGAGKLAQSLAGPLSAVPSSELVVLNRSPAAARALAARHGAAAGGLDRLDEELGPADAVVCATDAAQPLVTAEQLAGRRRPLLIVDLAVPRDVEPGVAALAGVRLHDIDAVQELVGRNLAVRRREARTAAAMVRRETERFLCWRRELEAAPALESVWRQAEALRRAELERAGDALSAGERELLDRVTASVVRKLLHGPCERLRAACVTADAAAHVEAFRMLFGVDAEPAAGAAANVVALPQREAA